jgi:cold shock CspA family protein
VPDKGRIVKLYIGQGYGFIRPRDEREIYFHRGDLEDGTSINDCHVGDLVSFERVEDLVSGPRARCVRRRPRQSRIEHRGNVRNSDLC